MKKTVVLLISTASLLMLTACGNSSNGQNSRAAINKSEKVVKHSKTNLSSHADSSTSDTSQDSNQNDESANDNDQTDAFIQAPWTFSTASSFLQKVYGASSEGHEYIGLDVIDLTGVSDSSYAWPSNKIPGNSIFVMYVNKSGAGDGGIVLTKNNNRTVTIILGSGAASEPDMKLVVDAKNGSILSNENLSGNYENMLSYFGIQTHTEQDEGDSNTDSQSDADSINDDSSDSVSDDSQSNNDSDSSDETSDSQSSEDDSSSQDSNNSVSVDSDSVDSNDNGD